MRATHVEAPPNGAESADDEPPQLEPEVDDPEADEEIPVHRGRSGPRSTRRI